MRGRDLLEDLQYLREEYIEEAGKIRRLSGVPGTGGFRYRHMAACLLVFCLAGGAAATVGYVNKGGQAGGLSGAAQTEEESILTDSGGEGGWEEAALEQEVTAAGGAQAPVGRMSQQETEPETAADALQDDTVFIEEMESGLTEADAAWKGESEKAENGSTEAKEGGQEIESFQIQSSEPAVISAGEGTQELAALSGQGQAISGYKILESPDGREGDHPVTVCYKEPDIGTYFYSVSVKAALEEHQGEKILYHLRLEVFAEQDDNESEIMNLSSDDKGQNALLKDECKRLQDAGYKVELEDSVIKGYFSAEDLEGFEPLPKYGYFFCFANEW